MGTTAPYRCEACGEDHPERGSMNQAWRASLETGLPRQKTLIDTRLCPKCGKELDLLWIAFIERKMKERPL